MKEEGRVQRERHEGGEAGRGEYGVNEEGRAGRGTCRGRAWSEGGREGREGNR